MRSEVQMSAQVKGTIRGGGSVKIEIINRTADTTDTIFRQSSAYDDTGSIQINKNIRYRFTTPAYYYIKVTVEASYPGGLGNAASAAVEAITFLRDRCPQEPDRSQRSSRRERIQQLCDLHRRYFRGQDRKWRVTHPKRESL